MKTSFLKIVVGTLFISGLIFSGATFAKATTGDTTDPDPSNSTVSTCVDLSINLKY